MSSKSSENIIQGKHQNYTLVWTGKGRSWSGKPILSHQSVCSVKTCSFKKISSSVLSENIVSDIVSSFRLWFRSGFPCQHPGQYWKNVSLSYTLYFFSLYSILFILKKGIDLQHLFQVKKNTLNFFCRHKAHHWFWSRKVPYLNQCLVPPFKGHPG